MFLEQTKIYEQKKLDWIEQCFLKSNSMNSKKNAIKMLKMFSRFIQDKYPTMQEENAISEMLVASNDAAKLTQVYLFLNQFVQYMVGNKSSPRTTRLYFAYLKEFCRYNGIRIYNEDRKQFVKLPKVLKEKKKPLTYDIVNKILEHCGPLYKAFILFAVSSGMRIGEIVQLRVSDLDLTTKPVTVLVRAEIAKMRVERTTFISREAYEFLVPVLKKRQKTDLIFFPELGGVLTPEVLEGFMSRLETAFAKIRKRAELFDRTATGLHQVRLHRLRDFFITKTDLIHEGLGHALAGHEKYMDEYNTYSEDELRKFYLEAESSLTISNDQRNKKIIEQKDQQLKRLDSAEVELQKLKDWKRRMEQLKH